MRSSDSSLTKLFCLGLSPELSFHYQWKSQSTNFLAPLITKLISSSLPVEVLSHENELGLGEVHGGGREIFQKNIKALRIPTICKRVWQFNSKKECQSVSLLEGQKFIMFVVNTVQPASLQPR